ncbi:MAG: ribosomal protein S18-alanine N-acetyltransferase [Desulfuromonadales bacterium]|jgi:ribosomal-protein-alanine N-acetyltransferase
MPPGDRIAPMRPIDLAAVHALEFASQAQPWSRQHFVDEMANPVAAVDLYWRQDGLGGFLCTWLIGDELQIQNLATAPQLRRQGIAVSLLSHVMERGRRRGLQTVWLEVRVSNQPAIALYRRLGFCEMARRRAYYADGEDAVIMSLTEVPCEV